MATSFDEFLSLTKEFSANTTLEIVAQSLCEDVFYDDLCQFDFENFLKEKIPSFAKSDIFVDFDCKLSLTAFYEHLFETKVETKQLYFKRLLQGTDLSLNPSDPIEQLRFQIAKQMRNYSYIVGEGKEVMVVDPCWDVEGIVKILKDENLTCVGAYCTHLHWDHIGGCLDTGMLQRLGIPPQFWGMAKRLPGIKEFSEMLHTKAFIHEEDFDQALKQTEMPADTLVKTTHKQIIQIGKLEIELLHTPGHTPGSQCLLLKSFSPMRLLTGDTMFVGSFGRIDGPECSATKLWESINITLGSLPDDTIVYPAHDYSTEKESTIAKERRTNPVFRFPKNQFVANFGN